MNSLSNQSLSKYTFERSLCCSYSTRKHFHYSFILTTLHLIHHYFSLTLEDTQQWPCKPILQPHTAQHPIHFFSFYSFKGHHGGLIGDAQRQEPLGLTIHSRRRRAAWWSEWRRTTGTWQDMMKSSGIVEEKTELGNNRGGCDLEKPKICRAKTVRTGSGRC